MENSSSRTRIISVLVLAALIGVSIWFGAAFASVEDFHHKDIAYLEEKQNNAKALSASASTASVLISLLPEDTASPLADQISNVGRDFMIILSALAAERYLLTITGRVTFCWIIPIGLGIIILFVLLRRKLFLQIGLKLAIAGCVLYMLVPVTLRITRMIDSSYEYAVDSSLQQSKAIQEALHFNENGIVLPGMSGNTAVSETAAENVQGAQAGIQAEAQSQVQKVTPSDQVTSEGTESTTQVQKVTSSDQASSEGTEAIAQAEKDKPKEELPWYEELWKDITSVFSGVVDTASQFLGSVSDTVTGLVNSVSDAFKAVSDMASTAVEEAIDAGEKVIAVAEMVPQVPQMAANLLNNLIDAFVLMIVTTCVLPLAVLIGLLFVMSQVLITNFDWGKHEA